MHRWRKGKSLPDELQDIRSLEESEAAADFILEQVRHAVEKPGARVIASIAGGRKTMGALLHAAMTLLGRETDRITHVLAPEPYESPLLAPKFYFPAQPCGKLQMKGGAEYDAGECRVELQDVPFVPIRNLFDRDLSVKKPRSFSELVARCRKEVDEMARKECRLAVQAREPEVAVNGTRVRLPWAQYAILRFFAEHALKGNSPLASYKDAASKAAECAEKIRKTSEGPADWREKINPALIDHEFLAKRLNDLRKTLTGNGNAYELIGHLPRKGSIRLGLAAKQIKFVK